MKQRKPSSPGSRTKTFASLSMVSGIFALISCCSPPAQFLFGSIAIMLAYLSHSGKPLSKTSRTGLILGIFSILFSLYIFIHYLWAMQIMEDPTYSQFVKEFLKQYQNMLDGLQTN